jgi:hypothetical protein
MFLKRRTVFVFIYMTSHLHVLVDSFLGVVQYQYLSGFVRGVLTGLYVTIIKEIHSY